MRLAKPQIDIGLSTERLEEMLAFWQAQPGVRFDHVLQTGPGAFQHRHDVGGSVLKINQPAAPIPAAPLSGYRELVIAADVAAPQAHTDPDGNLLRLVPRGHEGIIQIAIRLAVRDLAAHRRFYAEALDLPEEAPGRFRAGETLMILEESPDAPADAAISGPGWRYITLQIFNADEAHAHALANGAREGRPPTRLGDVAKFSMIRDPDGNWIELSQRASIVGALD